MLGQRFPAVPERACARAQASDDRYEFAFPISVGIARIEIERNPEACGGVRKGEARRRHAYHFAPDAAEFDGAADDAGIAAELLLPQIVTENDDAIAAGFVLARIKRAPTFHAGAQHLEEVGGYRGAGEQPRLLQAGEIQLQAGMVAGRWSGILLQGRDAAGRVVARMDGRDEPIRVGIGKGTFGWR